MKFFQSNLFTAFAFCGSLVILAKVTLPHLDWGGVIGAENGPVERMSAGLWFMAFCWCVAIGWSRRSNRPDWLASATILLLFGLRELDFHRWATGWNLDKVANYWNPQFPVWEKLLVTGLLLIPSTAVGGYLFHRAWVGAGAAATWNSSWIGPMVTGGTLLGWCLLLDNGQQFFMFLGMKRSWIIGVEEFCEFVLAVYVVSVLWPYWIESFF